MPRKHHYSKHALSRLRSRFNADVSASIPDASTTVRDAITLFTNGQGEYLWYEHHLEDDAIFVDIVFVLKDFCVVSVVTLPMAFADCPPAVFLALCSEGRLTSALMLRASEKLEELPDPVRFGIRNFDYDKSVVLWNVFSWIDKQQS